MQTTNEIGRLLTKTLKYAEKYSDNIDIKDVKFDPSFFKIAWHSYDKIGDKGLTAMMQAYSTTRRNGTISYKDFTLSYSRLVDDAPYIFDDPAFAEGIAHVLNDMASNTSKVSYKVQGARHHMHMMQDGVMHPMRISRTLIPYYFIPRPIV